MGQEIELLRGLRHRNVTRLLEVVDDERCPNIFLVVGACASLLCGACVYPCVFISAP